MATKKQQDILQDYLETQSYRETARNLGVDNRYVTRTIKKLEARGDVPWQSPAPSAGHLGVGKRTVQYNADGEVVQEWRRLYPQVQAMQDVVDGLCDQVKAKGNAPKRKAKKTDTDDILFELDSIEITKTSQVRSGVWR